MTTPQFDIRPSLIKGDPADAYLHWTKEVMRLESLNPKVLMDFSTPYPGVLCGVEEAKALLLNVLPKVEQDRRQIMEEILFKFGRWKKVKNLKQGNLCCE